VTVLRRIAERWRQTLTMRVTDLVALQGDAANAVQRIYGTDRPRGPANGR
jgi:hypothetical protein